MKKVIFSFVALALLMVGQSASAHAGHDQVDLHAIQTQLEQLKVQVANLVKARNQVIISSLTGPMLVKVGENGAWSINVVGDLTGKTRYAVTWGDEVANTEEFVNVTADATTATQQLGEFRHTYRTLGDYTVNFRVVTSRGLVAKASLPVSVRAQAAITVPGLSMSAITATVAQ